MAIKVNSKIRYISVLLGCVKVDLICFKNNEFRRAYVFLKYVE